MTKKTANRRQRDHEAFVATGAKPAPARVVREKTSRIWYELKAVHRRTTAYLAQTGEHMAKYANPVVLAKIAKNGKSPRFMELNNLILSLYPETASQLEALWNMHGHISRPCISSAELMHASQIFDGYQKFDMGFFETFSPILGEMKDIFNEALSQLLAAQEELKKQMDAGLLDPSVVSDVPSRPLPAMATDLVVDGQVAKVPETPDIGRGLLKPIIFDGGEAATEKVADPIDIPYTDDKIETPDTTTSA